MTHTSKSAVAEMMRVSWRAVSSIITRVVNDARAAKDPFDGLARIGIDEISYRAGPQVLDRGRRPRQRATGVGRGRPR